MKKIHTVIFDFDGTLADTHIAIRQAFFRTLKDINAPTPIGPFFDEICCQSLEGMFQSLGVDDKEQLQYAVSQYGHRYRSISPKMTRLFSCVSETLSALREYKYSLAIGTNESRDNLESLFPPLGLHDFFAVTVCEDEVSHPKPYPEMVHKIMEETGSSPSETLIVGDSVLDMQIGKKTGCYTCGVTYGSHSEGKLRAFSPDWIIHKPYELLGILGLPPLPGNIASPVQFMETLSPLDRSEVVARAVHSDTHLQHLL
jgi:HAD superfamily hydrolase (TIGR01509 family)